MHSQNYKLLYEFAKERYQAQIHRNDRLDEKIGRLLSFTTAFLGVTIVLISEGIFTDNIQFAGPKALVSLFIFLIALLLCLGCYHLIKGTRLREFSSLLLTKNMLINIDKDNVSENYKDFSERIYECSSDNEGLIKNKSNRYRKASISLSMAITMLGIIAGTQIIIFFKENIIDLCC